VEKFNRHGKARAVPKEKCPIHVEKLPAAKGSMEECDSLIHDFVHSKKRNRGMNWDAKTLQDTSTRFRSMSIMESLDITSVVAGLSLLIARNSPTVVLGPWWDAWSKEKCVVMQDAFGDVHNECGLSVRRNWQASKCKRGWSDLSDCMHGIIAGKSFGCSDLLKVLCGDTLECRCSLFVVQQHKIRTLTIFSAAHDVMSCWLLNCCLRVNGID